MICNVNEFVMQVLEYMLALLPEKYSFVLANPQVIHKRHYFTIIALYKQQRWKMC
jgi:hypothetical protein